MDGYSVHVFKNALKKGKEKIYRIRIMIVGHLGVGKTTLTKGLIQEIQDMAVHDSTDGIEIYIGRCRIDLEQRLWLPIELSEEEAQDVYIKLALVLHGIDINDYQVEQIEEMKTKIVTKGKGNKRSTLDKILSFLGFKKSKDQRVGGRRKKDDKSLPEEDNLTENSSQNAENVTIENQASSILPFDVLRSSIQELLRKAVERASNVGSVANHALVDIWDFGGQSVFYNTHQTFLSWRCIYALAFDVSKDIEDYVEDESLTGDKSAQSLVLEFIFYWINSIITYARGRYPGFPKIFLVATHLDEIPEEQREKHIHDMFSKIEKYFLSHPARDHLIIDSKYSLNALDLKDPGYNLLRQDILKVAESHPLWGEERPTSWLPLEEYLMKLKQAETRILSIEQVEMMNATCSIESLPKEELIVFLKFQHSLGHLLYFAEKNLRNFVILDPKFLIDALRSIITAERFCTKDKIKKKMWNRLSKEGILEADLMNQLWKQDEYAEFAKYQSHLINTMEKLDLLAKPKIYSSNLNEEISNDYFVPCMIKSKLSQNLEKCILRSGCMVKLVLHFKGNFLPDAIFTRLVACCLRMWPILCVNNDNIIFSSSGGFRLDQCHTMLLQKDDYRVIICIVHDVDIKKISKNLCTGIRHFITNSLERIMEVYDQTTPDEDQNEFRISQDENMYKMLIPCCLKHTDCLVEVVDATENLQKCVHHDVDDHLQEEASYWFPKLVKGKHDDDTCGLQCSGPPHTVMSSFITEQDLGRLSRRLMAKPDILAAALEISPEELVALKYDVFYGLQEQNFLLLCKWKDKCKWQNGEEPTFKSLEEVIDLACESIHVICKVNKAREIYRSKVVYDFLRQRMFDQPTDRELDELADRLDPRQGYQLCIELGVSHVQLDKIRQDFPNKSLMQMREGLQYWRTTAKYTPKLGELAAALDETRIYSTKLKLQEVIDDGE